MIIRLEESNLSGRQKAFDMPKWCPCKGAMNIWRKII